MDRQCRNKAQEVVHARGLVQLKKKVYRAPHILKQKLGMSHQIRDPVFDELEKSFKEVREYVSKLLSHCDSYSKGIRAFVDHSLALSHGFEYLLNNARRWNVRCFAMSPATHSPIITSSSPLKPTGMNLASGGDLESPLPAANVSMHDVSYFRSRQEAVREKIELDLRTFEQNLRLPLLKVFDVCKKVTTTLKQRESLVTDLTSLTEKFNRFETKKNGGNCLTARQEQSKLRVARDLELVKLKYETLNTTFKVELRVLFKLFNSFIARWAPNYFFISYSVAYTLYHHLGCHPEVQAMLSHETNASSPPQNQPPLVSRVQSTAQQPVKCAKDIHTGLVSMQNTVAKFHFDFDNVVHHMQTFNIIKFSQLYQLTLSSASDSAKIHFSDNACNGTIPTIYATALFDYEPAEPDQSTDLNFRRNEVIKVIKKNEDGWWYGEAMRTRKRGYFPANYVELERFL